LLSLKVNFGNQLVVLAALTNPLALTISSPRSTKSTLIGSARLHSVIFSFISFTQLQVKGKRRNFPRGFGFLLALLPILLIVP
jgi:hypothetical protein